MEDITKTGPIGLQGLSFNQENPINGQQEGQEPELLTRLRILDAAGTNFNTAANYPLIENVGLELVQSGVGDSRYDEGITYSQLDRIQDYRALNQPAIAQLGAGVAKGLILAGTTFLDGTIGLVVGATQAITEGRTSALWDNDFSRAMQSINEWSEEVMPNYYTEYEQNNPLSVDAIFSANFLGDKFIKNLGFAVGAFYSGGLYAGGARAAVKLGFASARKLGATINNVRAISNASDIVAAGVGTAMSAVNEGRIEALNNSTDWYEYNKALLDEQYNNTLASIERLNNPETKLQYLNGVLRAQNSYRDALERLEENRLNMGNADLIMNLPILMASNIIQFGRLYGNGFKTARRAFNISKSGNSYIPKTGRANLLFNITKGGISEGSEEMGQRMASEISGDYYSTDVNNFYSSSIDPDAEQETISWIKSFSNGINNSLNDASAWEEFIIGSLTGVLGIPTIQRVRNNQGKLQSPIKLQGGALNEWREYRETKRREQELVDYMNNRIQSPEFMNYYRGLIRHNKYQNDMNIAAEEDNEFNFKNAEHAQLVSDIIMFDEAGKIEDLKQAINEASGTSREDLESIVINTTTKDNNNQLIGPFYQYASLDEAGNIVANFGTAQSEADMANKIKDNRDTILNTISLYQTFKDDIIYRVGNKFNTTQISELTWMYTQIEDWNNRSRSIVTDRIIPSIDKVIERLSLKLESLKSLTESVPTKEEVDLINTINVFKQLKSIKSENLPYVLANNKNITEVLSNNIAILAIEESDQNMRDALQGIDDALKMEEAKKTFNSKLKEYISNPESLIKDNNKAREEQKNKLIDNNKKATISKINNTSVSDIIKQSDSGNLNLDNIDDLLSKTSNEENEELISAKSKIKEAKSISSSYNRLTGSGGILDNISTKDKNKQQPVEDAKKLLTNSKKVSESLDEFLDLDREAFLDAFSISDDSILEELKEDKDKILETLEDRINDAREILQEAKEVLNQEDIKLSNIPSSSKIINNEQEQTGHDSTTATVSVNNTNILNSEVSPYQFFTPSISSETFEKQKEESETLAEEQYSKDLENYWKPSITEYPIHRRAGDDRPFHEILRSSNYTYYYKVGNKIKSTVYSKEEVDKMEKVYNYLKNNGAFSIVNSGQIQPGERVTFFTDKILNNEVGEVVILIKDSKGRVIGNLTYENAEFNKYQTSLKAFRDKFIEEYDAFNATNDSEENIFEYEESTVAKNMIGKPQYTSLENRLPLNKIFSKGFKLGIAMTSGKNANIIVSPGRKKAQGQTKFERAILSPIYSVAGQSFVLLPTSRKQNGEVVNLTVPFLMAPYSEATRNTQLGTEIENVVKSFANIKTDKQAASAKFALQELLTLPDLHINLVNGDLVISLVAPDEVKQTIIYKGNPADSNMVSKVISSLTSMNISFQISRKYINTTFNNKDYNSMIGEVAETNLPTNTESTINEWFTINPISGGKEIKAKSPKTIGINPNRATPSYQGVNIGDLQFTVNSKTNEVLDSEGKPYSGKFANHARAKAHAIKINAKQDSVVKTDWGYYDLATDDFITDEQELQDTSNFIKERTLKINTENNTSNTSIKKIEIVSKEAIENAWVNKDSYEYNGYEDLFDALYYSLSDSGNKYYESSYNVIDKLLKMARKYPNHPISKIILNSISSKEVPVGNNLSNKSTSKNPISSRSLTNTKEKKAVFNALSTEQQNLLIGKSPAKQRVLMDTLVTAFDGTAFDESILGTTLDNFLTGTKLRESNNESYQKWDKEKELKWIQRVLPNLSTSDRLRVVEGIEGLIPIGNTGKKAYGRFRNGIIEIGINAARGTVYHEAFHAVTHTLLSDEERTILFSEAKNRYGDFSVIKLEEKLAEDFRRYVQIGESGFYGVVNRIFRTIKHLVNQLFGKEAYIDNLFYRINRGKLAEINYKNSLNIDRTRSYTEEELSILEKAPRDSEGNLLSLNGNPTKLSERQYAQVRTKAFKEWFGDWVKITQNEDGSWNIPDDVSKVIDLETGEPKVVYHGTPNAFTVFGENISDKKRWTNRDTFFFTDNRKNAETYGDNVMGVFLNIRNPYTYDFEGRNFRNTEIGIAVIYARDNSILASGFNSQEEADTWKTDFIKNNPDNPIVKNDSAYIISQEVQLGQKGPSTDEQTNIAKGQGNDGNIQKNVVDSTGGKITINNGVITEEVNPEVVKPSTNYVVFTSNQIKSATDNVGTYSTENNDIRYREIDISWYEDRINEAKKDLQNTLKQLNSLKGTGKYLKLSDGKYRRFNNSSYPYSKEAFDVIKENIPVQLRGAYEVRELGGRYYIVISSEESIQAEMSKQKILTRRNISEYQSIINYIENNKGVLESIELLENQESYYNGIEQYYEHKYDYNNLTIEDKNYIESRKISINEYLNMSLSERKILFSCK